MADDDFEQRERVTFEQAEGAAPLKEQHKRFLEVCPEFEKYNCASSRRKSAGEAKSA